MQGARTRWLGGARAVGWAAVVGAVWLAAACSEDGAPTGDGSSVSATIGPEGGSLALGDEVSLEVPPGALEAPTTITLSRTAEPAFEGWEGYSPVYRFEPEGLRFAVPAQVSIRFDGDPSRVELAWRADAADAEIEHVQTSVDGDRVLGEVSHFTLGMAGFDLDLITEVQCDDSPTGLCPTITTFEPEPARAGWSVRIRGRRFWSEPSWPTPVVRFGDQFATVLQRNWGSLDVLVPAYARTYVIVETVEGTSPAEQIELLPYVAKGYPSTGAPGTTVTFEGSGLRGATVVFPPGISAETTVLDGNLITAVVPEGARNGALSVHTPLGSWTCGIRSGCDYFRAEAGRGPEIGSVNPPAAGPNAVIEIRGARLLTDDRRCVTGGRLNGDLYCPLPEVRIGGRLAQHREGEEALFPGTLPGSQEYLDVFVPRGAVDGPVTVTTPDGTATWETFRVLPSVTAVEPTCGEARTPVTIRGTGFDLVDSLQFEPNVDAEITDRTATELNTLVPEGFSGDEIVLRTAHGDARTPFARPFPPWVEEVEDGVRPGGELLIWGRWLDRAEFSIASIALGRPRNLGEQFGGPPGFPEYRIRIPTTVPVGPQELTVAIPCGVRTVPVDVLPLRPSLSAFSPRSGAVGTLVTLEGSHLLGTAVAFAGVAASPTEQSDDRIVVPVPAGAVTGNVTVANSLGESASIGPFEVRSYRRPTITGLTPSRGRVGSRFLIEGSDLLDPEGNPGVVEMWPGVVASVLPSWTSWICTEFGPCPEGCCARGESPGYESSRLLVVVPEGAETGPIVVRTEGETTGPSFQVARVWVESFAPHRGLVGTEVHFGGGGLEGARVEFTGDAGGVSAVPVSSTDDQLDVLVPPGARSGPVTVIATDGERETPSEPFTVLEPAEPSIDHITPRRVRVGETVYVVGANLDLGVAPTIRVGDVEVAARACWSECLGPYTHAVPGEPMGALSFAAPHTPVDGQVTVTTGFGTALGPRLALRPSIRTFDPLAAGPGDRVVARGYRLGGATVTVSDGRREERALVLRTSDTEVEFVVPTELGRPSGIIPSFHVTATVLYLPDTGPPVPMEDAASSFLPYSLSFPAVLTRVEPTSGRIGDEVVIEGDGIAGGRVLFFDGIEATVVGAESFITPSGGTRTIFRVRVPEGATSGPLVVETSTGSVSNAVEFIVERSIDFTFAPDRGPGGTPVMIRGLPERLHVRVAFEGAAPVDAETVVRPEGGIDGYRVSVPADARTGPLRVDYQPLDRLSPWASTTSATPFLVPPSVSALSPDNGVHGAVIDAYGLNLTGASRVTTVDGAVATPTVHSDTHISFAIPPSAAIGTGPIAVTTPTGSSLSSVELTVLPPPSRLPTITSFSPDATTVGELVTIRGTNLSSTRQVLFAPGRPSFFLEVVGDDEVHVRVPTGARNGSLTLRTDYGETTSASVLTVLPRLDVFSPASGAPGATVTVAGDSFFDVRAVTFGGATAAAPVIVSDQQLTVTVPWDAVSGPISVTTGSGDALSAEDFVVLPDVAVTALEPDTGPIGTTVRIVGTGLASTTDVRFDGITVGAFSAADEAITTTVPAGVSIGSVPVTVTSGGVTVIGPAFTVTTGPVITGFSPPSGMVGATVHIDGTGFAGATSVTIGGTGAPIDSNTGTRITTRVPVGAGTGRIAVTTPAGSAVSATDFVVLGPPPVITSFAPPSGPVGTMVRIDGANLGATEQVRFNGITATFAVVSDAWVNAVVPVGATTGPITLSTPSGFAAGPIDFTVTASPSITSFSPTSGPVGTTVVISGSGFTGATALAFNATAATAWTIVGDTRIDATVPAGATTGRISVTNPTGTGTSASDFTVTVAGAPTITSLRPASGPASSGLGVSYVVIDGVNFAGATVRFGATGAAIMTNTGTQMVVQVPPGLTPGLFTVSVTTASGSATASFTVTMTPPTPVVTSVVPSTGAPGDCFTVNGVNLMGPGPTQVVFEEATPATVTSTSSLAVSGIVPVGAVTGTLSVRPTGLTTATTPVFVVTSAPTPTVSGYTPTSGYAATVVDVSGAGFGCGTGSVRFGTTAGTITSWTPSLVRVRVPSGLAVGTHTITLTTYGGATATVGPFDVLPTPPAPTITSFTPTSGTDGTVVTITGTNLLSTQWVRFGLESPPSPFVVDSDTQVRATVAPGSFGGPIRLATAGGSVISAASFTVILLP